MEVQLQEKASSGPEISTTQPNLESYPTRDEVQRMVRGEIETETAKVVKTFTDEVSNLKDITAANSVTILGIFASLFAFLIIDVQILKTVCDTFKIIGFSLFLLGALLLFATILLHIVDSKSKRIKQFLSLIVVSLILIISGVVFVARGGDEYVCQLTKLNSIFEKERYDLFENQNNWMLKKSAEIDQWKKEFKK